MGVYIKGMEMQTSRDKCPFLDYEEGFCLASGVKHESGWYESTLCPVGIKDGRPSDCLLVPVPKHGRLIDADEFLHRAIGTKCFDEDYVRMLQELVGESTTIIPAEEGET